MSKSSSGPALREFAGGLRRRYVLGQALSAMLRWGMLLALPVLVVALLLPGWVSLALRASLVCWVLLVVLAAAQATWRARQILGALHQRFQEGGDDLARLHDELATWLELDERQGGSASEAAVNAQMMRWLERHVHARLAPYRSRALKAIGRPRLGRWRWLVPVLCVCLLVWLLLSWFAPPWSGVVGGRPNQASAGAQQGQGAGGPGDTDPSEVAKVGGEQDPARGPDADPQDASDPQPEPGESEQPTPPQQPGEAESDPSEIPPLIEQPDDQHFVVPEFIGDGPTRRALMHAAELEEQAGGGQQGAVGGASRQAGGDLQAPKPSPPDFERAAEAAQRSRHVPPAERAMVRRFFDKLRGKAR